MCYLALNAFFSTTISQLLKDAIEEAELVRNSSLTTMYAIVYSLFVVFGISVLLCPCISISTEESYTPENRVKMYRQIAADREAKEAAKRGPPRNLNDDSFADPFVEARKRVYLHTDSCVRVLHDCQSKAM